MRLRFIVTIGVLLLARSAVANTIDFTAATLGAANTIQIGGVTITGARGALVATDARGLGINDGAFDETWRSLPDNTFTGDFGLLSISVDGTLNSLTIQPYLLVNGQAPVSGVDIAFQMSFMPRGDLSYGQSYETIRSATGSVTFNFTPGYVLNPFGDSITALTRVGLGADLSNGDLFGAYLKSQGLESAEVSYGYSITGIDYTPTPTPEPSELLLMAGFAVLGYRGFRGQSSRRSSRRPRAS